MPARTSGSEKYDSMFPGVAGIMTSGMPLPSEAVAILVPSALFTYRICGSGPCYSTSVEVPPPRTAHTRTASPTPFSACSPRSSNRTPADVRASDRTVSDTSTSPAADSPLIREAMFTAPP